MSENLYRSLHAHDLETIRIQRETIEALVRERDAALLKVEKLEATLSEQYRLIDEDRALIMKLTGVRRA